VVTNDRVELLVKRLSFDVVDQKAAAHRRLLIDLIRQRGEPLAGDLNQIVADVDSGHVVPDAREIFADPSRSATDIENLRIGAQRSEERRVGKERRSVWKGSSE